MRNKAAVPASDAGPIKAVQIIDANKIGEANVELTKLATFMVETAKHALTVRSDPTVKEQALAKLLIRLAHETTAIALNISKGLGALQ